MPIGYIPTPNDDASFLYQDITVALESEGRINNGQPTLHALCISALGIQEGEVIAQVGVGTGYYTALLSRMTGVGGSVYGYEIESQLAERARRNLEGLTNVTVHDCSGSETHLPDCDVIYVNAGATAPVRSWIDALRIGGRLVFPLTGTRNHGAMLLIKRVSSRNFEARFLCRAAFIPCVGARDAKLEQPLSDAFQSKDINTVRSLRLNTSPDDSCWFARPDWWLSTMPST